MAEIDGMSVDDLRAALIQLGTGTPRTIGRSPIVLRGKLRNALRQHGVSSVAAALELGATSPSAAAAPATPQTDPHTPEPLGLVDQVSADLFDHGSARIARGSAEVYVEFGSQVLGHSHYAVTRRTVGGPVELSFVAHDKQLVLEYLRGCPDLDSSGGLHHPALSHHQQLAEHAARGYTYLSLECAPEPVTVQLVAGLAGRSPVWRVVERTAAGPRTRLYFAAEELEEAPSRPWGALTTRGQVVDYLARSMRPDGSYELPEPLASVPLAAEPVPVVLASHLSLGSVGLRDLCWFELPSRSGPIEIRHEFEVNIWHVMAGRDQMTTVFFAAEERAEVGLTAGGPTAGQVVAYLDSCCSEGPENYELEFALGWEWSPCKRAGLSLPAEMVYGCDLADLSSCAVNRLQLSRQRLVDWTYRADGGQVLHTFRMLLHTRIV